MKTEALLSQRAGKEDLNILDDNGTSPSYLKDYTYDKKQRNASLMQQKYRKTI